jgi:hypothetical protein
LTHGEDPRCSGDSRLHHPEVLASHRDARLTFHGASWCGGSAMTGCPWCMSPVRWDRSMSSLRRAPRPRPSLLKCRGSMPTLGECAGRAGLLVGRAPSRPLGSWRS